MIRTRNVWMFVAVLTAAAIACGGAAAVLPSTWVQVHANLSGDSAAGTFSGLLVKGGVPDRWQLTWKLSLPSLRGPMSASLEVGATRVLCRRCTRGANGAMRLTATQARRITRDDAVVVVKTPSVTLRGPVKAFLHAPVPVS